MELYPILKMDYAEIDPIIDEWVRENSLYLDTVHKEVEVRSITIVDENGIRRFQIWIEPPEKDGSIGVHVWDLKNPQTDLVALKASHGETLKKALEFAKVP